MRDFRQHGQKAVAKVRRTQPAAYLKILALLVPREHKLEHSNPIKDLTDEQLEAMIEYIETSLAAQAGGPVKVIEGTIEATAVQATALPVLEPPKRKPNRLMIEADTAVGAAGAQAAQGAIACKHLTSQCLAATRGGSGLQTGKTSSHAGLCGTQVADAARRKPLGCDGPITLYNKDVSSS